MANKEVNTKIVFDISDAKKALAELQYKFDLVMSTPLKSNQKAQFRKNAKARYDAEMEAIKAIEKARDDHNKKALRDEQNNIKKINEIKINQYKEYISERNRLEKEAELRKKPTNLMGYLKSDLASTVFDTKNFGFIRNLGIAGANITRARLKDMVGPAPSDYIELEDFENQSKEADEVYKKTGTDEDRKKADAARSRYLGAKESIETKNKKAELVDSVFKSSSQIFKKFTSDMSKAFDLFGLKFSSLISDIGADIKAKLSPTGIASYDVSTSIFSNASARNMQMQYGISGGNAYALNKTMGMLNMTSMEDVMYMNATQKQVFQQLMEKQNAWYDQMQSSGMLQSIQMAQLDFAMLKEELSNKFLIWIGEHKDTILKVMEGTFKVMTWIFDKISYIIDLFGGSSDNTYKSTYFSDIGTGTTSTTNNTFNVNQTNNASAILNGEHQLSDTLSANNVNLVKQIASTFSK